MSILKRMSRIFAASLALLAISSGLSAAQAQGRPLEQTYRAILPQKVETGDRIEVIDFFWYG